MPTMREIGEREETQMRAGLPRVIREDHDPFKYLTAISLGTLFAFLRWSDFRCPHCGAKFRKAYLPNEVRLGRSERMCANCSQAFEDGSREWLGLSKSEKIRYIFPTPIMGVIGGFLVCAVLAIFARFDPHASVNWVLLAWVAGACAALIMLFVGVRVPRIRSSVRRSRE